MKFEESVRNINKPGKQSVILELKPEFAEFFDILDEYRAIDYTSSPFIDVLAILMGECCESDYIVTTDEDESHDFEELYRVVHYFPHCIDISKKQLREMYEKLKPFLHKRVVTWDAFPEDL